MQFTIKLSSHGDTERVNEFDGTGPTRLAAAVSLLSGLGELLIADDPEFWVDLGRIVSGEDEVINPDMSGCCGYTLTCECDQSV